MKKNWLVFARREKCHHREALENLHFIDWTMKQNNFSIGDIVYIYPTNEDGIKFKTEVVAKNCERKDGYYWVDKNEIDSYPTYRLVASMSQGRVIDIMTFNSYSLQYYSFWKGTRIIGSSDCFR